MEVKSIIWNKKELSQIKRIILTKANLTLDEGNNLIVNDLSHEYEMKKMKNKGASYSVDKELSALLYYQDREEIERILNMATGVHYNPENVLHFGLIAALAKINPNEHAQIFIILREIASQFEKVAAKVATIIRGQVKTIDEFKEEITRFKDSEEITFEEMLANSLINMILNNTNGVAQHEIFKDLTNRYTNNMKHLIIIHLENILANENKSMINKKLFEVNQYQKRLSDNFVKHAKKHNLKIYRD